MAKKDTVQVVAPEKKIEEISVDFKKFEKKQQTLVVIENDEQLELANTFLIDVKSRVNRIKAIQSEYIAPIKENLDSLKANIKNLESLFQKPLENYERLEVTMKRAVADYRLMLEKKAKAEEERLRAIQEEEDRKAREKAAKDAEKRAEKGLPPVAPAPIATAPIATVERMAKTVTSDLGSSTAKKVVKFEIVDYTKLPKKYKDLILQKAHEKDLDRQIIKKFVDMSGMSTEIEGVRVYEDFDISVKA